MLDMLKKRQSSTVEKSASAKSASVVARDFLPTFVHYNNHTLLTKDGGVVQTLRIGENIHGLDYEPHDKNGGNLRDCIRKALTAHIPSDHIAIWIHTLRKRRNVNFNAHYDNPFAAHVNAGWRTKNGWAHQYYNEVYITLVYDGQSGKLIDQSLFKEGITTKKNRMMRDTYIQSTSNEMDVIVGNIIDELSHNYRVRRLSIVDRSATRGEEILSTPIFYSEPMEFFSTLLNLRTESIPLPDADISDVLQSSDIIFGFNALETKNSEGTKRFGAILSLKQYREVPSNTVDMLLQAPMEMIISQAFHFTPTSSALKEYHTQKDFFNISGDTYSMEASGLKEILHADRGMPTDFGVHQTSIMVIADELKKIDEEVAKLQKAFGSIGLICVREDIRQEEIFWSMFPGNFIFLRRKTSIPTSRIGGFAKLNRFSSGRSEHNFWEEPVSLLPTLVNSPYFFNFHVQDNGHTLWFDFNSFNDRMSNQSLAFLLTQSHKLKPRIIYFDYCASAELWFNKIGGNYYHLHTQTTKRIFALNPFSLSENPRNIGFLNAWCAEIIGASLAEQEFLKTALRSLYNSKEPRNLKHFVDILTISAPALAARFSPWLETGDFGGLFSASTDDFPDDAAWIGIDLSEAMVTPQNAVAAFAYMLHRITLSLDGSPTIIVLQHAFPILQQPFFAARLESLLEMLKENNTMMILCMHYSEAVAKSSVIGTLLESCSSKVIVPDDISREYRASFPTLLSDNDQDLLCSMSRMQGDILIKQTSETVAVRINLDSQPDISAIFHNDIKTLISAGGVFASIPGKTAYD